MGTETTDKANYRQTLNLPKTVFAMRAGLAQKEPRLLARWQEQGLYQRIQQRVAGRPSFILHDGPPYANGNIHIGHALNKVLKDMIVKMKTMQGFDVNYIPGWDCHGLPIEHQLFKKMKRRKDEVDCVAFRQKAHQYAMEFVEVQKEQFQRLGVFGQWDAPYLTLDPVYEYWILKSLSRLARKGYVYRGLKPVNWCARCETALAEAEVEYEDHVSPSVYVKCRLKEEASRPTALLIWTTTPWTLPANVAVAVHPAFEYAYVEVGDEVLIMERSLVPTVLAKTGQEGRVARMVTGKELEGVSYHHPLGLREDNRVVLADYVTKEDGTGLVHIAPGHGQEDFEIGLQNHLPVVMPVDDRGVYTEQAGPYRGLFVFKANERVIEDLRRSGVLFAREDVGHSYPHCWRCKSPVIFRATEQWFLRIDHQGLRQRVQTVIRQDVTWIPAAGRERILGMVVNRPDWCLSRQRYWGVPIPALACQGCGGEHKLFVEVVDRLAEKVKSSGTNIWFEQDVSAFLPKNFTCPDCGQARFERTHDILDVWFDSGVSHQAVIKGRLGSDLPVDLYLEGSDQHRGWFQSSLIPAVALEDKAPFKAVLTHGFVVDGQGRKMSKSLGNVISPLEVIQQSGADILRLWIASSSYHEDIRISKETLDRTADAYRKIRNTLRYLLGNLNGFVPAEHMVAYDQMRLIDRWALFRLYELVRQIQKDFNQYAFSRVYKAIYGFCNEDLSSFYLDILKDRLYTSSALSVEYRSARTVLFYILEHLVRFLAPILVFTADEAFEAMPKRPEETDILSVHELSWRSVPDQWRDSRVQEVFAPLMALRPYVLKVLEDQRAQGRLGSSLEASLVFETDDDQVLEMLQSRQDLLAEVFIVSEARVACVDKVDRSVSEEFAHLGLRVQKADGAKCERCWKRKEDVGRDKRHPLLCGHCVGIVKQMEK